MHVRLLVLAIWTCFCIYSTNGDFENCCLSYAKVINHTALRKQIKHYQLQGISESCNMKAVIFYLKKRNRVICANPQEKWVQALTQYVDKIHYLKVRNYKEQHSKARQHG
ncbi:C-C motif chemokine 25-like [Discoglossus pictus]